MIKLAHPIIDDDDKRAVIDALESGQLAQGPRVAAFEQAFAAYVGVPHAVALNSGTAALHVALLAHGIGPGDDVIVPAFSFAASANAVLHAGARPIFADVRTDDFGIDPASAEAAITPATKAIIAVHLYGETCDITAIAEICARRGLVLIEDAAQAVGATHDGRAAGSFGTGAFSFYATKNLQTGEGGMITTSDEHVATLARTLRSQGERTRYVTDELGYNFRMTEVAAALGLSQLPKLDARNEQRRANAARLTELLAPIYPIITPRELSGRRHVYHQYTLRILDGHEMRDYIQSALRYCEIESAVFYPTPIHRQPLYQRLGLGAGDYPIAERLAGEVLSIPVHSALSADEIERVALAVNEPTVGPAARPDGLDFHKLNQAGRALPNFLTMSYAFASTEVAALIDSGECPELQNCWDYKQTLIRADEVPLLRDQLVAIMHRLPSTVGAAAISELRELVDLFNAAEADGVGLMANGP